jgi:hypothetical protein
VGEHAREQTIIMHPDVERPIAVDTHIGVIEELLSLRVQALAAHGWFPS